MPNGCVLSVEQKCPTIIDFPLICRAVFVLMTDVPLEVA
jgi:hypothetical protein